MATVRLRHPLYKAPPGGRLNYVVELPNLYPTPYTCNACSQPGHPIVHDRKALHLRLDTNGEVLVADGIVELLRTVPEMGGLEVVNEVDPSVVPPQLIGGVERLPSLTVGGRGDGLHVPGSTKYEGRDRLLAPLQPLADARAEAFDRKKTAEVAEKRTIYIMGKRKN